MESLTYGGVPTVLFVHPPTPNWLRRFPNVRAVGIAGRSRAMTPAEMDTELPIAFQALAHYRPAIVHYKTCSTFDSAPQTGSIGRAIEIGAQVFQDPRTPLVVGAPALQRFCVFGNLFARSGLDSEPYRLDRHPTMRCHPVTPMNEADLRVHLASQTRTPIELVDVLQLNDPDGHDPLAEQASEPSIVLFDTLSEAHLARIGAAIWRAYRRSGQTSFVAGSSGIEYAMVRHWEAVGVIPQVKPWTAGGLPQNQTLVVSGSCSPVTDRQISWALDHGFVDVPLDTHNLGKSDGANGIGTELERVTQGLRAGHSVVVHSCRGPDDARLRRTGTTAEQLGKALATILRQALQHYPLKRVAVTGGDTSGHVARELGIAALQVVGPMAPGSPLCVAHSDDRAMHGLEITFKGGQVGHDNFFGTVLKGRPGTLPG